MLTETPCSSISSNILIQEAKNNGYMVEIIDTKSDFFFVKKGKKKILFKNIDCGLDNTLSNKICKYKQQTYFFLEKLDIKIPKTRKLPKEYNLECIESRIKEENLEYPLVVKPNDGVHGNGVTCNIQNKESLSQAIIHAKKHGKGVLIQEFLEGLDHRIVVIGGKVIAVMQRIPVYIEGDGIHTIQGLIDNENENPLRQEGHNGALTKIKVDEEVCLYLKEQNLSLGMIIPPNKKIFLRRNANLSTGGTSIDKTDDIHPSIKEMCEKVARELNLQVCGIDYLSEDISKPLSEQNGGIIEINMTPWIRGHHFPSIGKSRNVAKAILDLAFKKK